MATIWLNHWFSTAYNIINMIKENEPNFRIIGTNKNEKSPIMSVCNEWYQEPLITGKDYVDFCLDFCKKHDIDVFLPRREMLTISKYKQNFINAGIRVMVDDYAAIHVLNQKDEAYEVFKNEKIGYVPDYFVVTNTNQFERAYLKLTEKYQQICFKFVKDEGGKSYRLIDNNKQGYSSLYKKQTTRISFDDVFNILKEHDIFSPIMLMPYLPDEEISIDCLKTSSGIITIPRVKDATRIEKVRYDEQLVQTCHQIINRFNLEQPCNIQFKYLSGIPYILEVNTRMSGGIQMGCMVSGINIPKIAVNKLLDIDIPWIDNRIEKDITHVEVPIILN